MAKGKNMTSQDNAQAVPAQTNDKELNFRKQEAMYQRMMAEKDERMNELQRQLQEVQLSNKDDDDDDDGEPYVAHKKLEKKLQKFSQTNKRETQSEIQKAIQIALQEERKEQWMKNNSDFYDVMQHAERLAQKEPDLAETILSMPDGFERQKLVYKNIKALNLHMPEQKSPSIQEKVDANRRSPYYQPTGIANSPYSSVGDFSESGKKSNYEKMLELKNRLRLG